MSVFDVLRRPFSRNSEVVATHFELPPGIELNEAGTMQTRNEQLGLNLYLSRRKPNDPIRSNFDGNAVIRASVLASLEGGITTEMDLTDNISMDEMRGAFGLDVIDDDAFIDLGTKLCLRFQSYHGKINVDTDLLAEIMPELEEYRKKKK